RTPEVSQPVTHPLIALLEIRDIARTDDEVRTGRLGEGDDGIGRLGRSVGVGEGEDLHDFSGSLWISVYLLVLAKRWWPQPSSSNANSSGCSSNNPTTGIRGVRRVFVQPGYPSIRARVRRPAGMPRD